MGAGAAGASGARLLCARAAEADKLAFGEVESQQLTQMCMVGTFQLIFDHNGIIGSFFRSQYIQAELAYGRFTLTKTQINTDSFAQ